MSIICLSKVIGRILTNSNLWTIKLTVSNGVHLKKITILFGWGQKHTKRSSLKCINWPIFSIVPFLPPRACRLVLPYPLVPYIYMCVCVQGLFFRLSNEMTEDVLIHITHNRTGIMRARAHCIIVRTRCDLIFCRLTPNNIQTIYCIIVAHAYLYT